MSEAKPSKKEMLRAFKAEHEVGGVYAIKNKATGKALIQTTTTISKAAGILAFAKMTGSCVHPLIAEDWKAYGPDSFELEILETLEKKDTDTSADFSEDVITLGELWLEKVGNRYI